MPSCSLARRIRLRSQHDRLGTSSSVVAGPISRRLRPMLFFRYRRVATNSLKPPLSPLFRSTFALFESNGGYGLGLYLGHEFLNNMRISHYRARAAIRPYRPHGNGNRDCLYLLINR